MKTTRAYYYPWGTLFLLLLLASAAAPQAATIHASACTATAIQTAVTTAAEGDTVQIPACTQTNWTGTVTIAKRLIVQGTGAATTILRKPAASSNPLFTVQCSNGAVSGVVLHSMALQGTGVDLANDYGIVLENRCVDFQVHSITFTEFAHSALSVVDSGASAGSRGVIYACTFSKAFVASNLGYSVRVIGNGAYGALSLGTQEAVFIEDNTFTNPRHSVTSNNGSVYVFRHNTVTGGQGNASQVDAHGLSSYAVGSRSSEIYANMLSTTSTVFVGIGIRGGDGVIYDNVLAGPYSSGPKHLYLTNDGTDTPYPRPSQIRNLYIWDNTHSASPATVVVGSAEASLIQLDRDYFLEEKPGYTPFTYPHPLRRPVSVDAATCHFVWNAITTYVDGTPAVTLAGYRLSVGPDLRAEIAVDALADARHPALSVPCASGEVWQVRGVEATGRESEPSSPVMVPVALPPLSSPDGLTLTEKN